MSEIYNPVITEVGIISGRDAIHLDEIRVDYAKSRIELFGEFASALCSNSSSEFDFIKYAISFAGIFFFKMTELDFSTLASESSFDEVLNSKLVEHFKEHDSASKLRFGHKHYVFRTYDYIFEVVCQSFELKLV
jgi:hypothetical protein